MPNFYVGQTDYITQLNVLASSLILPTVAGNTGKYLITDGISTSWAAIPTASTSILGLVKVDGTTISINGSGVISGSPVYSLPTASTTILGGVKIDNTTITVNGSGVISAPYSYTLPTASTSVLGGVKVDGTSITILGGVIRATYSYTLPTASTSVLGGIKIDNATLSYNASGQLYYTGLAPGPMPTATTSIIGGVKIDGTSIIINSGVISGFNGVFASLTSKPTTLAGYGITDTLTTTGINTAIAVETTRATTAEALLAPQITTYTKTETDSRIQAVVGAAPAALDTLLEIATQLATDESVVGALTTAVSLKAPIYSPTFTGTVTIPTGASIADYARLAGPTFTGTVTLPPGAIIPGYAPIASPTFTGIVTIPAGTIISGYATIASPTFTGTVTIPAGASIAEYAKIASPTFSGIVTIPTGASIAGYAKTASPTFTGIVGGITKEMVGLEFAENTRDLDKVVSTATITAIGVETTRATAAEALLAPQITTYTKTETDQRIQAVVGAAPAALDTLLEIATQLATDESAVSALTNVVSLKAPIASPTFTGIVTMPSGAIIPGYAPIASPTFTGIVTMPSGAIIPGYAPIAGPTFTGTVTIPAGASIAEYAKIASPTFSGTVTIPTGANIAGYATLASPTFSGTVGGITKGMVGLEFAENTRDLDKVVSTATITAIGVETTRATAAEALLAPQITTYTKTETDSRIQAVVGAAPAALDTLLEIATQLATDESAASALTTVVSLKAPLSSPTFTGVVTLPPGTIVSGYAPIADPIFTGAVTIPAGAIIADYAKIASPIFTGTVTIPAGANITGFAKIASPTFTGTVGGITKKMVGLEFAEDTNDLDKPVSTATNNALNLKAPITSPTFIGIVKAGAFQERFVNPALYNPNSTTLDFADSAIFYLTSNSADITAYFINVPTTANYISTVTLIIAQGGTAYIPSSVVINTVAQTIKWANSSSAPIPTANKLNLVSFSFIATSTSTWTVIGNLSTY